MTIEEKAATLVLNRKTGYYEGTVLVQVDADLFRRMLLQAVEEDEQADLTDPQTWVNVITRVGKVTNWLHKPTTKVTSYCPPPPAFPIYPPAPTLSVPSAPSEQEKPLTKAQQLENRIREQAQGIAPHLWEEHCLTPIAPMDHPEEERKNVGRLRYDERQVLKKLRAEWEAGIFCLSTEATKQEQQHRDETNEHLMTMLQVVEETVNNGRFQ